MIKFIKSFLSRKNKNKLQEKRKEKELKKINNFLKYDEKNDSRFSSNLKCKSINELNLDNVHLKNFILDKNKKNLLIIDDYPNILDIPKDALDLADKDIYEEFNVLVFTTSAAGEEFFKWREENKDVKIDYAILDILINGIDSVDILYKILEDQELENYIFLSGCDINGDEYKFQKAKRKYLKFIGDEKTFNEKFVFKLTDYKKLNNKILSFLNLNEV